jgi:ketopantoate hydroxymethyltransferase
MAAAGGDIAQAITQFGEQTRDGSFPATEHTFN